MNDNTLVTVADRIEQLMDHLGIEKAHFAGREIADWAGSAAAYPERLMSLTLVCPPSIDEEILNDFGPRVLVYVGDQDAIAGKVAHKVKQLHDINVRTFSGYPGLYWSDVVADNLPEMSETLLSFLRQIDENEVGTISLPAERDGEISGISYQIRGSGPPLILLPLAIAPSQWEPLIPSLRRHYCTITLGGPHLGSVARWEERARVGDFLNMAGNLLDKAQIIPGESILDVGSGSGALTRWLSNYTHKKSPITGIDINNYLVETATHLAKKDGLADLLAFSVDNAEELSFPDESFDVTFSMTTMEEVNANKMLAEMIRVTKPGGKVAVIVRAIDISCVINIPLQPDLGAKVNNIPYGGMAKRGCADATLYRRFHEAGLRQVMKLPQLAAFDESHLHMQHLLQAIIFDRLSQAEQAECHAARALAEAAGTFFIALPHHCAIGTKLS